MKLLIDNALSPQIALALRESGYDAIHVPDISLHAVPDELFFAEAERSLLFANLQARHSRSEDSRS